MLKTELLKNHRVSRLSFTTQNSGTTYCSTPKINTKKENYFGFKNLFK